MISSIILLLVMHFKFAGIMPWNVWFRYMTVVIFEVIVWLVSLKKLDEWDLKTNYGRGGKDGKD